jgi:cytochrome c oxidase subunit 2
VFATDDDLETAYELVVPLMESIEVQEERKLVFQLRSRDVLHSFFVPYLRLKQDAVPGMTIPIWFDLELDDYARQFPERDENGDPVLDAQGNPKPAAEASFDVICAELCGWGHYKMSGRVRVLNEERYAEWEAEMAAKKYGNE